MKSSLAISLAALGTAAVLFFTDEPSRRSSPAQSLPAVNAQGTAMLGRLPVAFVPNVGQWQHAAHYVARIGPMTVFVEDKGWTFTLVERTAEKDKDASARGVAVRMTFAGARTPELAPEDQLSGRHNYFVGNDPSMWRSNVPLYRAVRYREVHPGVDVRAREQDGHFEYDLILQPDALLDPVEMGVEGIQRMHMQADGALVLETRLGPVRMPAPLSWEEGPSDERSVIACRYVLHGDNRFGFEVTGRRPDWALVVDPGLVWSTFLGGGGHDSAFAVAVDLQGAVTVVGETGSLDFPTTPGAFDTTFNGSISDVFVTRLAPSGSNVIYSTFLGGVSSEVAHAVALDARGGATLTGYTSSPNFPVTAGAFDTSHNGGFDAFVAQLSPSGGNLVYSTFLGGAGNETAWALALDAQDAATVAGQVGSTDFPITPGAFDTSYNGGIYDAFVTRLSPSGSSLTYSTFLGGVNVDRVRDLGLDAQGAVTVAGHTYSPDFPATPGAFDPTFNGASDIFIARLSPSGANLTYSTFLGGTSDDTALALALDAHGDAAVAGDTFSADFPITAGAFDTTFNGGFSDAFITRLSSSGASLVYSTFIGGSVREAAHGLALDARGGATVTGITESADFPTTLGAFDTTHNSGFIFDAFIARLSPSGSSLVYSTFLGSSFTDRTATLAVDAQGAAIVAGITDSDGFPTTPGAFDTTLDGGFDAFVTRLDMLPTGASAFGRSSPGCTGPLAISVTSMPNVGNATFTLTCGNAPPNTSGLLGLTVNRFPTAVIVLGVELWIDPTPLFVPLSASSNNIGASEAHLPIPNDPALVGGRLFAQFFWAGPASPPPCPPLGLSASSALDITIQP